MPQSAITAYYSHSYRSADRIVNEYFADLLYESGLTLTVDPKSTNLSPTQLEMMMRDSDCFVGVVTYRDDQPWYKCSPFAVYEYELALRAPRKARILFVERGVSDGPFLASDLIHMFNRGDLASFEPPSGELERLCRAARASGAVSNRPRGRVGLILPPDEYPADVRTAIVQVLRNAGYRPETLQLGPFQSVRDAAELDAVNFAIVDVASPAVPDWIGPYLMWRFVPSIKLIRHETGAHDLPELPALLRSAALETASAANRHAIWWSDPNELISELALQVNQLDRSRRQFQDVKECKAYFRSLDRANGPVFISNAWDDNPLAQQLAAGLATYNIDYFHYQYRNTIPVTRMWRDRLLAKVDESRIFVPLLTRAYQNSEWCQKEYERADELRRIGRLTMIPCFLEHLTGVDTEVQGVSLMHLTAEERVARIVAELQTSLETEARLWHRPKAVISDEQRPVQPDIAVIAVSADLHEAVVGQLDGAEAITGTSQHPNRSSWATGTVRSPRKGRYRIVVARPAAEDEILDAIRRTVDAFEPDSVILLGRARAVERQPADPDVVVTTQVYGYEYRQGRFAPRPGWTFPTDPAVSSSATTITNPPLAQIASTHHATGRPQLLVGPVACGGAAPEHFDELRHQIQEVWPDARATEETLIGAVQLLEDLRERGRLTQFSVLWSIRSDADTASPGYAGEAAATVLTRLVADVWPRPPVGDEPEGSSRGLGPGPA